jgi:UPF0176 protein
MEEKGTTQIISFYEFKDLDAVGDLSDLRAAFRELFMELGIRGTIILAKEGYNGMVCGEPPAIERFLRSSAELLDTKINFKSSFHEKAPFRKIDVKIKPEVVTLRKDVDISLGRGSHVAPGDWNALISDPETVVLDARNAYEYKTGTFLGAVNLNTTKFSELPSFVAETLDPERHKRIAMFCTGGIRCEKFAPYMKQLGFEEVFQLEGGILRYLEETPPEESLWEGECFVFDERITVDSSLNKGKGPDHSQRTANRKKADFKVP